MLEWLLDKMEKFKYLFYFIRLLKNNYQKKNTFKYNAFNGIISYIKQHKFLTLFGYLYISLFGGRMLLWVFLWWTFVYLNIISSFLIILNLNIPEYDYTLCQIPRNIHLDKRVGELLNTLAV